MSDYCHGNGEDHCCYLGTAGVCEYIEEYTVEGRRWACGLYRELGSWDVVHDDPRYQPIKEILSEWGYLCGTWGPGTNQCCFKSETEVVVNT